MRRKIIVPLMAIALICVSVINYSTIQSGKESGVTLRSLVKISSAESEIGVQCLACGNYFNELCPDCIYYCNSCCICEPEPEPCPHCYSTSGCDCANTDCDYCGSDLVNCSCNSYDTCLECGENADRCNCFCPGCGSKSDDCSCGWECSICNESAEDCTCNDGSTCWLCGGNPNASCPECF